MGDSSTIDFMYIPDFDPELRRATTEIRVPILPWINPSAATKAAAAEVDEPVCLLLSCYITLHPLRLVVKY